MKTTFVKAGAALTATALATTALTACSTSTEQAPESIIATTQVWADVASAVTGETVDAIISDVSVDPHTFEPSAKDLARIQGAETVVSNGGHYDMSLYTVAEQDRVIFAIPPLEKGHTHDHDHDQASFDLDDIEHIWFNPAKVAEVAHAVAERAGGDAGDVEQKMHALEERLAAFDHVHLAMTEPIAAGLIYGTELHDITPAGYLAATIKESEPSAQDVADFLAVIESGNLDFLVFNPQSTNSASDRLVKAAKEHNIPVVEMTETPPAGVDFLDYMEQVVGEIEAIVANAEPKMHHH